MEHHITTWYPYLIALVFLGTLYSLRVPHKGAFAARAFLALLIATFLAHVNRIFLFVPEHALFPSGHTTFCLGLGLSLALLRPWTLYFTLPCLVFMAYSLVALRYHEAIDIFGAVPLVFAIYIPIHYWWRLPTDPPLLDRAQVSA